MHPEENYMTYVEEDGCCDAVMFRLSKKRNFILITVLLILSIISILAGLFNGFTLKKYSDMALTIGIFVPSIILVLICVYLAFICGRESFRSSILSRINHLSRGHANPDREFQQYPQIDSETRDNLRVRYQSKACIKSLNYPLEARRGNPLFAKTDCNSGEIVDSREAKISRKHIRSFSSSDISKRTRRNFDSHSKNSEVFKFSSKMSDDSHHSPRFLDHQDVKFKRSVSDTTNRSRYAKAREDRCTWNTYSLDKLRKHIVKKNSSNDAGDENNSESYEAIRPSKIIHHKMNSENIEPCEKTNRFKEYKGRDQRSKSGQLDYVNGNHVESIREENCYTKSEIRVYSSSILKPYEYKQTLRFSSFQPDKNAVKDFGEMTSFSSSGDEKANSLSRTDTLEMERKANRLENLPSDNDTHHLRRKTIYYPSTSSKEKTRPSREYAHEYCRYTNNEHKVSREQFSSDEENFEQQQIDKQVRFQW